MMKPICWRRGVAPDEEARFQILRGGARVRGRDTHERADTEGDGLVHLARAADEDEHDARAHQSGDRHARDRVRGRADDSDDPRRNRHEEESENDDEEPHEKRAWEWSVRKTGQDRDEEREGERAPHDDPHPEVVLGPHAPFLASSASERFHRLAKSRHDRGEGLQSVITPAHATAPAPMYRTYA